MKHNLVKLLSLNSLEEDENLNCVVVRKLIFEILLHNCRNLSTIFYNIKYWSNHNYNINGCKWDK